MNKLKCRNCGLVNASSDATCRRCGEEMDKRRLLTNSRQSPREAAKKSSWIYTILFLAIAISAASYLFKGVEKSYDEVNAIELNRAKTQPKKPVNGLSTREEFEHQQTASYSNSMKRASGLSESQKHVDETKKLMQSEPDKTKK
ncbi:hypothetical protein BH10ACI2_BH10ACI2_03980 [soil metagenome]